MKNILFIFVSVILISNLYGQDNETYSTLTLTKHMDQFRFQVPGENRYWFMSKTQTDNKAFALYSPDDGGWFTYWKANSGDMIVSKGRLGIGTSSPSSILDVEKNFNGSTVLEISNNNSGNLARRGIIIGNGSSGSSIFLLSTSTNYNEVSSWSNAGILGTGSQLSNGLIMRTSTGKIRFQPNGASDKIVFDENGYVGIGTTSPAT
jgi:hypothetical protein